MATLIDAFAGDALAVPGHNNAVSMTFHLDCPHLGDFIKVALGQFFQWSDNTGYGAASVGLVNMRRRKPDNSDETITFPYVDNGDAVHVLFDPTMTHVTFGISVRNCIASLIWTHEVFV